MNDIANEKEELFDSDFRCINQDQERVVKFCDELTKKSSILCCTKSGKIYEYLPQIYNSVVKSSEM